MRTELDDLVTHAIREAFAGFRPEVLHEMANETGPTELTPFAHLADAAIKAVAKAGRLLPEAH